MKLILNDGGVGAFAHEYGHALDYYAGMHVEKSPSGAISGGQSTSTHPANSHYTKTSLHGLMENLLYKIIWKNKTTLTDYYKRLEKNAKTDYYIRRNEIFARAFEVYVQYKLQKHKYKNVFLNRVKYNERFYLSLSEMKKLEKDFDALMIALKKHL